MKFWIILFRNVAGETDQFEFDSYWDFCVKLNELMEGILREKIHAECELTVFVTEQYQEF